MRTEQEIEAKLFAVCQKLIYGEMKWDKEVIEAEMNTLAWILDIEMVKGD